MLSPDDSHFCNNNYLTDVTHNRKRFYKTLNPNDRNPNQDLPLKSFIAIIDASIEKNVKGTFLSSKDFS